MNKILKITTLIICLLTIICGTVQAVNNSTIDTSRKASLTITQYEYANGETTKKELKGAEYSIYAVTKDTKTVSQAEAYIQDRDPVERKTTPESGNITFSNLELGRYYVVETKVPKNALTKTESFLVDLPRTSDNGDEWNYDVTVSPKTTTIYGDYTFTHNLEGKEDKSGEIWRLEKQDKNGGMETYVPDGTIVTDKDGKFVIENLEKGSYKIMPLSLTENYVLNQSRFIMFDIGENNLHETGELTTRKMTLEHYVETENGENATKSGVFGAKKVTWKTIASVDENPFDMEVYSITEELPQELALKDDSISLYGMYENNETKIEISEDEYELIINGKKMKFNISKPCLNNFAKIIIQYDTTFETQPVNDGEYKTKSTLEYTNHIDENGDSQSTAKIQKEAIVYTASVLISNTDEAGNALKGAKYKIATSMQNAKDGIFLKDANNNDIEVTSGDNGYVIFNGLKIGNKNQNYNDAEGSYWLVEIKAPTYTENGTTKYYNLNEQPIEVIVNKNSGIYDKDSTTIVQHKKGFILPLTGGTLNLIPAFLGTTIIGFAIIMKKRKNKNVQNAQERV